MSALPPFTVLWGAQAAVHNPPGGPLKRSQAVRLSLPASYLGGGGGCQVPEPLWALPNQEPRCKTQPCFCSSIFISQLGRESKVSLFPCQSCPITVKCVCTCQPAAVTYHRLHPTCQLQSFPSGGGRPGFHQGLYLWPPWAACSL